MTVKEQLLQELSSVPDSLITETLDFLRFLKTKERCNISTSASLLAELKNIGTWQGDDLEECLQDVVDTRLPTGVKSQANPFD